MLSNLNNKGIHLIYGPGASGKTTICLQEALKNSKSKKVLFVDTEKGFSTDRLKQMDENYQDYLENIILININNFNEQVEKLELIESLVTNKFGLLIIDSFTNHYRYEMQRNGYKDINLKLINILRKLKHISENIPVILTSQVYSGVEGIKENKAIGGNMLKNFSKCIFELEKEPRKITMLKPEEKNKEIEIKSEGLVVI